VIVPHLVFQYCFWVNTRAAMPVGITRG